MFPPVYPLRVITYGPFCIQSLTLNNKPETNNVVQMMVQVQRDAKKKIRVNEE